MREANLLWTSIDGPAMQACLQVVDSDTHFTIASYVFDNPTKEFMNCCLYQLLFYTIDKK